MSNGWQISILGLEDEEYTATQPSAAERGGWRRQRDQAELTRSTVDSDKVKGQLNDFLSAMRDVVGTVPEYLGSFHLTEITLSAEVSASGKISLMGASAEVGGKGGIGFKLIRERSDQTARTLGYATPDDAQSAKQELAIRTGRSVPFAEGNPPSRSQPVIGREAGIWPGWRLANGSRCVMACRIGWMLLLVGW